MLRPTDRIIANGQLHEIGSLIAEWYKSGDSIVATRQDGLLVIPAEEIQLVDACVHESLRAFDELAEVEHAAIRKFFSLFAQRLANDDIYGIIKQANDLDISSAERRGRSTTRLKLTQQMRESMIQALKIWETFQYDDSPEFSVEHEGWKVDAYRAPLGVVTFVFEGRPNVFADATGVLTGGNVCIFRIGSDAYETAKAIMKYAVEPSLHESGLPVGCITLLPSKTHSSAWALFSHPKIELAVARGSGASVALLGEIAQQQGTPVSLHGTGGAWMIVSECSSPSYLQSVIANSLDRKVCNTLNTIVFISEFARSHVETALQAVSQAAHQRNTRAIVHVHDSVAQYVPESISSLNIDQCSIELEDLHIEWEWENSPEVSLVCVNSVAEAVELFNAHSPYFLLSVVSDHENDLDYCWKKSNSPFFCNGFTRWVDGQYALRKPELGLSNWQQGRALARGGILSGDSMYTIRYRMRQSDANIKR